MTMPFINRYALGPNRPSNARDITAFVEAVCVANSISAMSSQLAAEERVERRRSTEARLDGWYEGGVWYEPAERRRTNAIKASQLAERTSPHGNLTRLR
jgi:hypothetical protein